MKVCEALLWHVLQAVTAAAALNDVGSWALVGFQATFYSRVYEVGPEVYAPALAAILPIGGLLGGVGGGLAGDWLSKNGSRVWLTAGVHPPLHLVQIAIEMSHLEASLRAVVILDAQAHCCA